MPLSFIFKLASVSGDACVIDAISAKCWLEHSALIINPIGSFTEAKSGQYSPIPTERNDAAITIITTEATQEASLSWLLLNLMSER